MKDNTVIFWGAFAIFVVALGFLHKGDDLGLLMFTLLAIYAWARFYRRTT